MMFMGYGMDHVKPVFSHNDTYIIRNDGTLFRLHQSTGNAIYVNTKPNGSSKYLSFCGRDKTGICKWYYIHRIVAEAFVPNPDPANRTQVNHKDNNPKNNHYTNLEWVTQQQNLTHYWDNYGERKIKIKIRQKRGRKPSYVLHQNGIELGYLPEAAAKLDVSVSILYNKIKGRPYGTFLLGSKLIQFNRIVLDKALAL